MTGERLYSVMLEGLLNLGERRIRIHYIAPLFEEDGVIEARDLYLASYILRALAPLQLYDDLVTVFVYHVLGDAVTGVFHVHLDYDRSVSVMIPEESVYPPVQLRRLRYLSVLYLGLLVYADHVLSDDYRKAHERCADGKGFPIFCRDEGRAERAGHDRCARLRLHLLSELRFNIDVREYAVVFRVGEPFRQSGCAVVIA